MGGGLLYDTGISAPFYPFFFYLRNQKSYLFEIRLKTVVRIENGS
jgi:hypothetical protein